ncbi:hypothetical protein J2T56_002055 [Natronobacillus azotifigens]|uniref:Peptide ABC transporter permease n=1 Tax=Natronobacillus azotifigens TaxID=472978 RepID=A0A9J6RDL7_9BACI|nr:hypothetical protein [Natronobacillus azotifigens]MCZ0703834.1 hypothetical protein [Natronobacillus azotifigens]
MLDLNNINEHINHNSKFYWPEFKMVAYALYDKEMVYLYNHPKFTNKSTPYYTIPWNNEFNGANTLIMYEDYPTAIVNLDYYQDTERLYAIVLHELFHGLQYLNEEKRFPNEFLAMIYPLSKENVELRSGERKCLYHAVLSPSHTEKTKFLKHFIYSREKRRNYINEFMAYEACIETVEGPAFYIELQAYSHISFHPIDDEIKEYGKDLLNNKESAFNLRRSCYSSGLYICLLLDELYPDWKEGLFNTDKQLYDILKEAVDWEVDDTTTVEISSETNSIIRTIRENKQEVFRQFENKEGYHLLIRGDIICNSFDPMNVVAYEGQLLHKNFLSVLINEKEFYINQPVITHYYENFRSITTLHIVVNEKPVYTNGVVSVKGLGKLKGEYYIDEGLHHVII